MANPTRRKGGTKPPSRTGNTTPITFAVPLALHAKVEERARELGFKNVSQYLRSLLRADLGVQPEMVVVL